MNPLIRIKLRPHCPLQENRDRAPPVSSRNSGWKLGMGLNKALNRDLLHCYDALYRLPRERNEMPELFNPLAMAEEP